MHVNRLAFIAFVGLLTGFPLAANAQGAIDNCISGIDALAATASNHGTEVADRNAAKSLALNCEKAEQQAAQSPTIRLATARALIWAGRSDAAVVRLEQIIDTGDQEAADLAAGVCARGLGTPRVQGATCGWMMQYPPSDPAIALAAGQRLLQNGAGEAAMCAIGIAAEGGDQTAADLAATTCLAFDPADLTAITNTHPAYAGLDPAFVAALSCEAAYIALPDGDPRTAEAGFNFATAMTFFDDYASAGGALLELAGSQDPNVAGRAADAAMQLCTALAGDPNDPNIGANGVADHELIVPRALPICEVAAYVAPTEGEMHYNLSRAYAMNGEPGAADAAWVEAERLGYPLATGPSNYQVPGAAGPVGGPQVLGPGGQMAVNLFNRPEWINAFYTGDLAPLLQDRGGVILYLKALMQPFEDPSVWFKAGSQFQLAQDYGLMPQLELKMASDPDVIGGLANTGLEATLGGLKCLAGERRQQINQNVMDPGREIAAWMGCMMSPLTDLKILTRHGEQDGIRLVEVFNSNPGEFMRVYEGIKKFVYR